MSEKIRDEFEKVYVADMNDFYFSNEKEKLVYLKKNENSEYVHNCTKEAYYWWCKSRENLVVELPEEGYVNSWQDFVIRTDLVKEALDNVGISYK